MFTALFKNPNVKSVGTIFFIASCYFVVAFGGLKFATVNGNASPVWPASGFAIAAMFFWGRKSLVGIFLGSFFVNLILKTPILAAFGVAIGTSAEALIADFLWLAIFKHSPLGAGSGDDSVPLLSLLCSAFFAPFVSAGIGISSLFLAGAIPSQAVLSGFWTWWAGDCIGILAATPFFMALTNDINALVLKPIPMFRFVAKISLLCGFSVVLSLGLLSIQSGVGYLIFAIPATICVTFLLEGTHTWMVFAGVSFTAIWATQSGLGPFRLGKADANLMNLQAFLGLLALALVCLERLKSAPGWRLAFAAIMAITTLGAGALIAISLNRESINHDTLITWAAWGFVLVALAVANLISVLASVKGIAVKLAEELNQAQIKNLAHQIESTRMNSVGTLASGIAHEVNNPLMIMSASLGQVHKILQSNAGEAGLESKRELLTSRVSLLQKNIQRLEKLVFGLRVFSNVHEFGASSQADVLVSVENAWSLCSAKNVLISADVSFAVENQGPLSVQAAPSDLNQICAAIFENSLEAMSSHGIKNKWIKVRVWQESEQIHIWIQDAGLGVADEVAQKIMDPFFTTKPVGEGPGLGLSVAQGLARKSGGFLKLLESEKNTTFSLVFFVAPPMAISEHTLPESDLGKTDRTTLRVA